MHNFKNHRVQDLYDYLVNDFNENDFTYDETSVLKNFWNIH